MRLLIGATLMGAALVTIAGGTLAPEQRPKHSSTSVPHFVDIAQATGLTFTHTNGASGGYAIVEIMGSGGALFDFDGDGDLDVFLVQGGELDGSKAKPAPGSRVAADGSGSRLTAQDTRSPEVRWAPHLAAPGSGSGLQTPGAGTGSRLFRNDLTVDAHGVRRLRFTDVTAAARITPHDYGMGAAVGDYDGDGDPDLYVTTFGANVLYRNNGDGTFADVTREAGVDDPRWSTSAAFFDYDRDGRLDLFVVNYLDFTLDGNKLCYDPAGARDYCGPRSFQPVPARLFHNEGGGRFADSSGRAGISKAFGAGLGVTAGDYNGDGWLDLYVANDATPNQLWINQRDGTFVDEGPLSGAAVNAAGNPEGSMGIASGDYDADGDEDLFITNIINETFALYRNDGRATFDDVRVQAGLAHPTAAFTGFGTEWFDYDHDGWLDLLAVNGAVNMVERQRGQPSPFRMKNLLFRNLGTGRFEDVTSRAGPALQHEGVSRGAAFGDVDNDGDVDVLVTVNGRPVRLLSNESTPSGHWIQITLQQDGANRAALGARIKIERTGAPPLWRRVRSDGSYLSASDSRVHVGLGRDARVDALIVEWPDGAIERWTSAAVDRVVTLRRGTGSPVPR